MTIPTLDAWHRVVAERNAAGLDSLLAGEDAADLLVMVAALDAGVGKAALRYLGLFRPGKGRLTFSRSAKLLGELLPQPPSRAEERRVGTVCRSRWSHQPAAFARL